MILLTGATGLVGSHILYSLTAKGERVKATRRKNSPIGEVEKLFHFYAGEKADDLLNLVAMLVLFLLWDDTLKTRKWMKMWNGSLMIIVLPIPEVNFVPKWRFGGLQRRDYLCLLLILLS
jgi:NAD dependent epimerase/dehydratase family enzyme